MQVAVPRVICAMLDLTQRISVTRSVRSAGVTGRGVDDAVAETTLLEIADYDQNGSRQQLS